MRKLWQRPKLLLNVVPLIVLGLIAGAVLFVWSGAYNVAASRGHWFITEWFLAFGMRQSVSLRARFVADPPQLDNPNLYTLGAGHFHSGCAFCHGTPGKTVDPLSDRMLPPPPDLAQASAQWNERELFWIIKHGIKYTGMPAWVSQHRNDEVWALVAFVKRLPQLDPAGYRALALGGLEIAPQSGRDLATANAWPVAVNACARCHGSENRRPASNLVPILHGQPSAFLAASLQAFARGQRESGIMQNVASELSAEAIEKLAQFYGSLPVPPPPDAPAQPNPTGDEQGRRLVTQGHAERRIPACIACHGADAVATYPRLAGQNAAYMAGRLRRWKAGLAVYTPGESIMAPIARLLSDEQINAVSAYFESLPGAPANPTTKPP